MSGVELPIPNAAKKPDRGGDSAKSGSLSILSFLIAARAMASDFRTSNCPSTSAFVSSESSLTNRRVREEIHPLFVEEHRRRALYFVGTMARLAMANAVPGIVVSTISFQRRRMKCRTKSNALETPAEVSSSPAKPASSSGLTHVPRSGLLASQSGAAISETLRTPDVRFLIRACKRRE